MVTDPTNPEHDEILTQLMKDTDVVIDKIDHAEDYAALIIGVKAVEDPEQGQGVITCVSASGYYGIIEEGLYAELSSSMEEGNPGLFNAIRNAVRAIEEDYNIDPTEDLDDDGTTATLH